MVPQTLINIIESSFAIATVWCVLSHLQLQAKINRTRKGFIRFLENLRKKKIKGKNRQKEKVMKEKNRFNVNELFLSNSFA